MAKHIRKNTSYTRGKRIDIDTAFAKYEKKYEKKASQLRMKGEEMVSKKLTKSNFAASYDEAFADLKRARKGGMLEYNPTSTMAIDALVDQQASTYSIRQALAARTYMISDKGQRTSLKQAFAQLNDEDGSQFWYDLYAERAALLASGKSRKEVNDIISQLFFYGS